MTPNPLSCSLRSLVLACALAVTGAVVPPPALSQTESPEDYRDEIVDQFLTATRLVDGAGPQDKEWVFTGDPVDPTSGLRVVRVSPFIDRECRKEAVAFAVDTMQEVKEMGHDDAVGMARRHLSERRALIRDGEVDYASYLRHIGECKAFCAPLISELMRCHQAAVASHEHEVVFFGLNRHEVDEPQRNAVAGVARALRRDPRLKILLIGRASRIGRRDYNRVLSGKRVLAVRDALRSAGIAEDRIETLWLGFEPPQISRATARSYGIEDQYRRLGDPGINQSVVLVAYASGVEDGSR